MARPTTADLPGCAWVKEAGPTSASAVAAPAGLSRIDSSSASKAAGPRLLSLGSSFWYAMLANLLKLRSVITRKEEEQRSERQTSQAPGAAPNPGAPNPGTLPPELAGGEAGNLAALG